MTPACPLGPRPRAPGTSPFEGSWVPPTPCHPQPVASGPQLGPRRSPHHCCCPSGHLDSRRWGWGLVRACRIPSLTTGFGGLGTPAPTCPGPQTSWAEASGGCSCQGVATAPPGGCQKQKAPGGWGLSRAHLRMEGHTGGCGVWLPCCTLAGTGDETTEAGLAPHTLLQRTPHPCGRGRGFREEISCPACRCPGRLGVRWSRRPPGGRGPGGAPVLQALHTESCTELRTSWRREGSEDPVSDPC